jgi:hypothetical protein
MYHTNKQITKLEPRKNPAILVGYSDHMHYKLYDIKLRKTIWTRDAVILEGKFLDQITRGNQPDSPNNQGLGPRA